MKRNMVAEIVSANDPIGLPVIPPIHDSTVVGFVKSTAGEAAFSAGSYGIDASTLSGFRTGKPTPPVDASPLSSANPVVPSATDPRLGTQIGRFQIESVIASGGMGTVYKAVQHTPVRRTVALKMIRRGMADESTLRRFHAERQALALMDHPDIAQVFEADATPDGNPYFAMEFCTGQPIDQYCKSQKLDLNARLHLIIRIARAVQQAHSRGVIHRDLKPGNVLVSQCEGGLSLKIIDFGIAKFTDDEWQSNESEATRMGELVGTPAYMSPEQATGTDIDGRTDVFAIGAILFKLLTDTTPLLSHSNPDTHAPSLASIIKQLQAFVPVIPSNRLAKLPNESLQRLAEQYRIDSPKKLIKSIRGDLDWITLRAIEPDRTRRYATANDLADDIQRFLNREPVSAIAPSTLYKTRKFYERNRAAVITSVAICFVILISSIVSGIGWWNYEQERREEIKRVAEEAEILIDDAQASIRLATRGGPDANANFHAAESAIAKAETLLTGPHGLPHLADQLNALRRTITNDRSALHLINQLEDARERAVHATPIGHNTRFGQHAGLRDMIAAFEQYGIQIVVAHPDEAARRLIDLPPALQPHLIESLDFLLLEHSLRPSPNGDDLQHLSGIAHWTADVLKTIDPDYWRDQLRQAILMADPNKLNELSQSTELSIQPAATVIQLAQSLHRIEGAAKSIPLLQSVQEQHPENYWANHALALALAQCDTHNRHEQSIRYLTAAVSLRPHSLAARMDLAVAHMATGDHSVAVGHLRLALAMFPGDKTILMLLDSIASDDQE